MRVFVVSLTLMLAGCAGQNLIQAQDARQQLVGMSEEKIVACMGRPHGRFTFGSTEVWQYNSGAKREKANGTANAQGYDKGAMSAGVPVAGTSYCIVNIAMSNRVVQSVNYSGLTGVLPEDGQCASAVRTCVPQ